MASELFDNFRMNSDLPNFERDLFDTVDDMVAFSEDYLPDVFECNTKDGKRYRFNRSNEVDANLGKWRLVEGGNGGTTIEDWTSDKDYKVNDLVIVNGTKLYRCKTVPQVDNTVFDKDEWTKISSSEIYTDTIDSTSFALNSTSGLYEYEFNNPFGTSVVICSLQKVSDNSLMLDTIEVTDTKIKVLLNTPESVVINIVGGDGVDETTILKDSLTAEQLRLLGVVQSQEGEITSLELIEHKDDITDPDLVTSKELQFDGKRLLTTDDITNSIEDWVSGTYYSVGTLVIYNDKLYKCKVAPVDNTVFNIDEWQLIGNEGGASVAENVTYQNDNYASLTNVKLALDQLIEDVYYVNPEITSFTATPNGGVFEIGETITSPITFDWTYNKNVSTQSLTDCILTDNTDRTATYGSDITSNKTFTLTASDDKNTVSKTISYTFVNPYYVGVSNTNILTESEILTLTKKVEVKGSKTIDYTTSQSYMVFAYPSSYRNITKIIDKNGFDVTSSFKLSNVTVNSVSYNVYVSNKVTGSYQMTFSI